MNTISKKDTVISVTFAGGRLAIYTSYPWAVADIAAESFRQGAISVSYTNDRETVQIPAF